MRSMKGRVCDCSYMSAGVGSNVDVFVKTCCVGYVSQRVLELLGFTK